MKKILGILSVGLLCIFIGGCVNENQNNEGNIIEEGLSIQPSLLSEETINILKVINEENIVFYDLNLNDTIKSFVMNTWVYKNDEWQEMGLVQDNVDSSFNRIGINVLGTSVDLILMKENGYSKSSFQVEKLAFENSHLSQINHISNSEKLEVNQEITLWYKVGTDKDYIGVSNDFREANCTEGFAITLTLSDQIIQ